MDPGRQKALQKSRHFWEKRFVIDVLDRIDDLPWELLEAQKHFVDGDGRNRYIDFAIGEPGTGVAIAIEIDGWDKVGRGIGATRGEHRDEKRRGAAAARQGWTVLPFAASDVKDNPGRCAATVSEALDRTIDDLAKRQETVGSVRSGTEKITTAVVHQRRRRWPAVATAVGVVVLTGTVALWLGQIGDVDGPAAQADSAAEVSCAESIEWSDARRHIGEQVWVRGRVHQATYRSDVEGSPTFVNVGNPFPRTDRFDVVIFASVRADLAFAPEGVLPGRTVCVEGEVLEREGVPQIVLLESGHLVVEE